MRHVLTVVSLCAMFLPGCTERPNPAEIFIATVPPGASCILNRDGQPAGSVSPTPGIALVARSPSEVAIDCRRAGFRDLSTVIRPRGAQGGPFSGESGYEFDNPVTLTLVPR